MSRRPGRSLHRRIVRWALPTAVSAVLAVAPVLGVPPAGGVTPEEALAAGYVPNPAPALARITIEDVTPRVLDTAGSDGAVGGTESGVPTVTVTETVRNVGELPLEAVDVRLQRGPRATDAERIREPLVWSEPSFSVHGEFQRIAESIGPGETVPYRVTLPARAVPGREGPHLELTEPGVYPLLVNVNGTPEGSAPARLDDARTLLPVLDVPAPSPAVGAPGPGDDDEAGGPGPDEVRGPTPLPLTLLWPLAAPPARLAQVPGATGPDATVVLPDDALVRDLTEQGRLTGLLRAAATAFDQPDGDRLRRATCLGVDPDLLGTVSVLAEGRPAVIDASVGSGGTGPDRDRQRDRDDAGRRGTPVDGEALAADAGRWLAELRTLAAGTCVVTLPAAQADLDAVARIGDPSLTGAALDRAGVVRRVLEVEPLPDLVVPASGTLAPATPTGLGLAGTTALLAAPSARTDTGLVPPGGLVDLAAGAGDAAGARALLYPASLGTALAATGDVPENPRYSDPASRYWLTADTAAARLQDARAALLAPIVDAAATVPGAAGPGAAGPGAAGPEAPQAGASEAGAPEAATQPAGVLAVPPAVWTVDGASAASLLETLGAQLAADRLRPLPLAERLAGPVTVPDGTLAADPTGAADPGSADPFGDDPAGTTDGRLREALAGIRTLRSLVDTDDPRSSTADDHLDPMVGDALRVLSETGRRADGDGVSLGAETGAAARVRTVARLDHLRRTVDAALAKVDVLPPGSVFTMASPNSPLLLVARNALPFPVRVRVEVTAPPDLHVDQVGVLQIPASGSRTLQVPTQSDADGGERRTVTFALHGPDGTRLSDPVELSVQAGGYPLAQVFAIGAGVLALLLVVRRYLRYRRGTPDPADEGHRP